jgi:hypothetical protein
LEFLEAVGESSGHSMRPHAKCFVYPLLILGNVVWRKEILRVVEGLNETWNDGQGAWVPIASLPDDPEFRPDPVIALDECNTLPK